MGFNSEGSFMCHTCCDTGPQFIRSYSKDRLMLSVNIGLCMFYEVSWIGIVLHSGIVIDMFLYIFIWNYGFIHKLENKKSLLRPLIIRYINDILYINNDQFHLYIDLIYPNEVKIRHQRVFHINFKLTCRYFVEIICWRQTQQRDNLNFSIVSIGTMFTLETIEEIRTMIVTFFPTVYYGSLIFSHLGYSIHTCIL
jgi:hypothetical protein